MDRITIATRIYNQPLAIAPAKLQVIIWALRDRLDADLIVHEGEIPEEMKAPVKVSSTASQEKQIAVIDVFGSLVHRARGMDAESGLLSYESVGRMLEYSAADPLVAGIMLRVDSPGGEVAGVFELAKTIRAVSEVKPVWSVIDGMGLSAGYLLASQAKRVLMATNAKAGSIGIVMIHLDQSQADAKAGRNYTVLSRGAHKADFSPHAPLSGDAKDWAEKLLDREYGLFVDYVSDARHIAAANIRGTEAGILSEEEAVSIGLADGRATYHEALAEFSAELSKPPRQKGVSMAAHTEPVAPAPTETTRELPAAPAPLAVVPIGPTAADYEEIAMLCAMARRPQLAAQYIGERKTLAQVRTDLLRMASERDEETEVFSPILPTASAGDPLGSRPKMSLGERMKARYIARAEQERRAG